ncbi:hypothetical protein [Halobacillus naozhouensis]|uniref:DUF2178 domain-containing protein n=1 Tax=Halobacillus naozhouensis TaxID=554880 RepID=A0ABY8IWN0_9BACI|nr:hypothetical protein [Halobacillus naozhouensis]WFT73614.1 hypothetical protein P9989_14700 [Halobacillus naozhouensis]
MNNRYITMLAGGIVGVGIVSLIVGAIQWGLLIGLGFGISIAEWLKRRRDAEGVVESDERVEFSYRKFLVAVFGLSNFLLFIYLFVRDQFLNQELIEVRYIFYYLLATFAVCIFIGPAIIKKK